MSDTDADREEIVTPNPVQLFADELAWLAQEKDRLDHYDERWRLSSDPVRVAWQVRADEYAVRKAALVDIEWSLIEEMS